MGYHARHDMDHIKVFTFLLLILTVREAEGRQSRAGRVQQKTSRKQRNSNRLSRAVSPENSECEERREEVETLVREPVVICVHRNVSQCHYSLITHYQPTPTQVCDESYSKKCRISFSSVAQNKTVSHCYRPVRKKCGGSGPRTCVNTLETHCTSKYDENSLRITECSRVPRSLCGAGCSYQEEEEKCHEKQEVAITKVPQELCDVQPVKTCRYITKLTPRLKPVEKCQVLPGQFCKRKYRKVRKMMPLVSLWCGNKENPEQTRPLPETDRKSAQPRKQFSVNSINQGESKKESGPIVRKNQGSPKFPSRISVNKLRGSDIIDVKITRGDIVTKTVTTTTTSTTSTTTITTTTTTTTTTTKTTPITAKTTYLSTTELSSTTAEEEEDDLTNILNPFSDVDDEYSDLTEREREDLEDFNLGIQLELFRTKVDNDFPRQDFSQFVDVNDF